MWCVGTTKRTLIFRDTHVSNTQAATGEPDVELLPHGLTLNFKNFLFHTESNIRNQIVVSIIITNQD
jgi:hypothetical protein